MFCKNCGKKLSEKAKICPNCGEPTMMQINMDISKVNISNSKLIIIGIIGCALVFLSVFMPFVSAFGYTKSILDGSDGIFIILPSIIALIFFWLKKRIIPLIMGIVELIFFIIESNSFKSNETDTISKLAEGMLHKEIGYYLLLFGVIIMIASSIIMIIKNKKVEVKNENNAK